MTKRVLAAVCCCASSLFAQFPQPKLYYPLDGTLPPVAGVMPVNGTGVFGAGMPGFGQAVTNAANALRAPLGFNEGAEPGTSDWTLSFWARFTWTNTMSNFRLFSKGGQSDSGDLATGFQLFCRNSSTFSAFFGLSTNAAARERIDANVVFTKFKNSDWNHVAFMRRGAAMRIYLNGEFIAEKNPIAGGASGDYGVKTNSTNGSLCTQLSPETAVPNWGLDDVATWMSALTDAQVLQLYQQGTNGVPLSGFVTVPSYQTVKAGPWEEAATWQASPVASGTAFVRHDATVASALPNLYTLAVQSNAVLTLGTGASLAVTKTGEDGLRVGYGSAGTLALAGGAGLSVTGLFTVGAETYGSGSLTADAAALYASEGLRIGHLGGSGSAEIRNGASLTTRLALFVGNETNSLGKRSSGSLRVDAATVSVTNDYLSVGRNGATGTLTLVNGAVLNKSGLNNVEFGNRADSVSSLDMDHGTLNILNPAVEVQFGKYGSRSTVSLTDSVINMGARLDFAHQKGSYVEASLTRSSILKTTHDGTGLLFCEGGAATCAVTVADSTFSITYSGGSGANGIQLAPSTNGRCALTNVNSVLELVSTNGSRVYIAGGATSRVAYVQSGSASRLVASGDLRLGDGAASAADFRQLGGAVRAQYLWLANAASAAADYTLSGGTLAPRGLRGGTGSGGRLIFDGGTYAAATNADTVIADGKVQILFSAGKQAVFDTANRTLTLLQYHSPQGAGGLTKQGSGTLRIPGTYTGPTAVEAGTLALCNNADSTAYAVAEGATLLFDGLTNTAVAAAALTLNGTLAFNADAAGRTMARLTVTGGAVALGASAQIAFPAGMALLPGKSFTFLDTDSEELGARAQGALNIPAGWMVTKSGTLYTLQEITPSQPPLNRDDVVVWLSRETLNALPANQLALQVGAFAGTGLLVSNAPRNDLLAQVQSVYFSGAAAQAMHGPAAPEGITGSNTWSAAFWVWSQGVIVNNEPTVVCWGLRKGSSKQNCALVHASTEQRAASFFGTDPKYSSGAPALSKWQHIAFSYSGATTGQGLSVYVNGEPRALDQLISGLTIPNDGQTILLGNQHNGLPQGLVDANGRPYEGFLGELVIFDGTLSASEAATLYTNGVSTYVGSTALPDTDQVFETLLYSNWTNAPGWRNGSVPYGNSALVAGPGVRADVDSAVPSFFNLRADNGAAVNIKGTTFRPDGTIAISNGATVSVTGGGLLNPSGPFYVQSGSAVTVSGAGSKLAVPALNSPLHVGNETLTPSTLTITDGAALEVRNSNLLVSYNTDAAPGNGRLALSNATLTVGSSTMGGSLYVGCQSGTGALTAVSSTISVPNGTFRLATALNNGTAQADLLLDSTVLNVSGGLYLGFCESDPNYRSKLAAGTLVIRNKSSVSASGEFILGNRNAASDDNQPMTANAPATLVVDDSTVTLNSWATVARQNGLGTLIITNNAQVIKKSVAHFRVGTDGNATAGQGANTNPYTEGRVHVSAGGLLDIQTSTNELRIAWQSTDKGVLTIGEGGTVKAYTITGSGTRGALVFEGGTLQARASTNVFVSCAVPLLVGAGKQAVLDTQAYSVAIPRPFGGAGGLTKRGNGTLTLSALSTNTGPVTVEQGTLIIANHCGVGGTLTVPVTNSVAIQLGTSNVADTVSLGGLHLAKNLTLDLLAPGVSDKLVITTTEGFTAEAGAGLTLGYDAAQAAALFAKAVRYTIAEAPVGCVNAPVVTNLPKGWFVAAQPSGGTIRYVLSATLGTTLLLR